ncbi:MAG: glycoside hydrolase family 28 protein, partial [Alistipes sp.]|nr:glycoside hydrolase family 28 protein [Alistipes sp.]
PAYSRWLVYVYKIKSDDGKTWYPSESYRFGATTGADQNVSTWAVTREDFEKMHDFLRPVMVSIIGCENVLLEGVTFQNSPCWNIHPALCVNLTVENITVRCPEYAQNGDGIDIESCRNVVLRGSKFDVGDDGICIKSGKDKAGRDRGIPCENVLVENCVVFHGHGGFVVGSEMSGGVKNVVVTDCVFSGTDVGLRFKSTRGRGGVVENIRIDRIAMNNIMQEPLLFDLFYGGKSASEAIADGDDAEPTDLALKPVDETTPAFRDIHISNVWCRGARRAMYFNGLPEMNVERVTVEDTHIYATTGAQINEATDVVLRNVSVVPEKGPALMINNVRNLKADGFACPEGMACALTVTGSRNRDIEVRSEQILPENASLSKGAAAAVTLK